MMVTFPCFLGYYTHLILRQGGETKLFNYDYFSCTFRRNWIPLRKPNPSKNDCTSRVRQKLCR